MTTPVIEIVGTTRCPWWPDDVLLHPQKRQWRDIKGNQRLLAEPEVRARFEASARPHYNRLPEWARIVTIYEGMDSLASMVECIQKVNSPEFD